MFMRSPAPLPGGRRRILVLAALVLFAVYFVSSTAASLWTDYLWFESVGYTEIWWSRMWTRVGLLLFGLGLAFFFIFANLALVDRMSLRYLGPPTSDQDEFTIRMREWIEPRLRVLRIAGSVFLALLVGGSAATWIDRLYLFSNPHAFGKADPVFGIDVGFYVFQLPLINDLLVWAFNLVLITILVVAAGHYLNGALRLGRTGAFLSSGAKVHLSLLLAGLALLRAGLYQIDAYRLLYSDRAAEFFGPGFTEVTARLPAIRLLLFVSVFTAAALIINIWRQGWTLPVVAAGAWILVAVGAGMVYPAVVDRFQVVPQSLNRQAPYIAHNIDFTRTAYEIDQVAVENFAADTTIEPDELDDYEVALSNLRLWDMEVLWRSFAPQEFRDYFTLDRVDTDRYLIDGAPAQVMLSVRELDPVVARSQTNWQLRRLSYTHGYGAVVSHAARIGSNGQPDYLVSGLPPESALTELSISQPRIYFGEVDLGREPVIVNSAVGEIDFGDEATSRYQGTGGVELSNIWRRAAMALRYRDFNMILSDEILPESRILMERNVTDIIERLAPFLAVDSDPYPILMEGRVHWVIDLYSTSRSYPLSTPLLISDVRRLPQRSGIQLGTNYLRNSAKAVIDSYDGTTTFYAVDETDPIIRAWIDAYPTLFQQVMPEEVRGHLRYPLDLFTIQTNMYREYHVIDTTAFFQQSDQWSIPERPLDSEEVPRRRQLLWGDDATLASQTVAYIEDVLPYYLLMPLDGRLTYAALQSFTPRERTNLAAFMVVDSDPDTYGQLTEFRMPSGATVAGIAQVQARIEADANIAAQFTLWRSRGSRAIQGDIMIVPIGDSLLYVQPVFLEAEAGGLPAFERVIVVYGERIEWGPTLADTLDIIFGSGTVDPVEPELPESDDATELLDQAAATFELADQALRNGDLAGYQRYVEEARALLEQARALVGAIEASRLADLS
jgi:hypothetical protein